MRQIAHHNHACSYDCLAEPLPAKLPFSVPPDERQAGLRPCREDEAYAAGRLAGYEEGLALAQVPAPEGTRLVLMSEELMLTLGADRVEWGEPDQHGWFTPTLYRDSRLDAHVAQEPTCPICPHPAHREWCEARPHGDPCSCRQSATFAALPLPAQEERPDIDVERLHKAMLDASWPGGVLAGMTRQAAEAVAAEYRALGVEAHDQEPSDG